MERFVSKWCHLLFKGLKCHTLDVFTKTFECRTISGWSDAILFPAPLETLAESKYTFQHQRSLPIWLQQSSSSKTNRYLTEARGRSSRKHNGIADEWKRVKKLWTSGHINSQLILTSSQNGKFMFIAFQVNLSNAFLKDRRQTVELVS